MRHTEQYALLHLTIQGKIMGKGCVGRRKTSWLRNLRVWFNRSSAQLFRAAEKKIMIANLVASIIVNDRDGKGPEEEEEDQTLIF